MIINKNSHIINGHVPDRVNFKGASTNSDIYKVLDKNTSVTILDYEGDWSKVKNK